MAKASVQSLGWWAFIVGMVVAIIAGYTGNTTSWAWLLIILGLVVGYFNVSSKEAVTFLVATLALMASGTAGLDRLWLPLGDVLSAVVIFIAPAAIVVAVKSIYAVAK